MASLRRRAGEGKSQQRMLYFCIVAKGDVPIFEVQLGGHAGGSAGGSGGKGAAGAGSGGGGLQQKEDLVQFILHAALDGVEHKVWTTTSMYLKTVDKFNDLLVSAFATAGHVKMLLLHDHRVDEGHIKAFFHDVHEHYLKVLMNPFYEKNSAITSPVFEERVHSLARRLT
eukprot:TRINITY_DN98581_c0_g1_i1.p1 TRINITY_DN98581_c0_g1~~TRINITY_DN98581_c0_g1_i1.p1  ORF type:complete len:170 (-),score=73.41 TRINITY_DN98581_c0_g1_i1:161-670(-)